jgi:hypothetical protein
VTSATIPSVTVLIRSGDLHVVHLGEKALDFPDRHPAAYRARILSSKRRFVFGDQPRLEPERPLRSRPSFESAHGSVQLLGRGRPLTDEVVKDLSGFPHRAHQHANGSNFANLIGP